MSRTLTVITLLLLLSAPAMAGTQSAPELSDASGDQSETDPGQGDTLGVVDGEDHDFSDADILAAWISEVKPDALGIFVQTAAAAKSNTDLAVSFKVEKGPTSVFGSTASGVSFTIESTGTTLTDGPATVLTQADTIILYEIPFAAIGVSGGDLITELAVSTSRSEAAGCPAVCTAQTGTDAAPDTGVAATYTVSRIPVFGAAQMAFVGGSITESVVIGNGTNATTENKTRSFIGGEVSTMDVNASLIFELKVTNAGTDVDTFNLSIVAFDFLLASNITAALNQSQLMLNPGQAGRVTLSATLSNATITDHGLAILAKSSNGANQAAAAVLTVEAVPAPLLPVPDTPPQPAPEAAGRSPLVGAGTFLQDAAEAMSFDKAFDDYAELVLLALAILLAVLLVFLILILAGGSWIRVTVTPKHQTVGPGQTAEFHVEVRNKKRRFHDALAYFDGDSSWKTGVLLKPDQGAAVKPLKSISDEAEFSMGAKEEPGDHLQGTLRVQAPHDAGDKETDSVKLNIVPLGPDGERRGRKAGSARVTVRASNPGATAPARAHNSSSLPVRMSNVVHQPADPSPGDSVTTTATIENDSLTEKMRLRVVLRLDGTDMEEEVIEVPPRSARAVLFPWIAGEGANHVKVQVFLA